MELENACSESLILLDFVFAMVRAGRMNLRISDIYFPRQPRIALVTFKHPEGELTPDNHSSRCVDIQPGERHREPSARLPSSLEDKSHRRGPSSISTRQSAHTWQ
jgi:hypothetical protein